MTSAKYIKAHTALVLQRYLAQSVEHAALADLVVNLSGGELEQAASSRLMRVITSKLRITLRHDDSARAKDLEVDAEDEKHRCRRNGNLET